MSRIIQNNIGIIALCSTMNLYTLHLSILPSKCSLSQLETHIFCCFFHPVRHTFHLFFFDFKNNISKKNLNMCGKITSCERLSSLSIIQRHNKNKNLKRTTFCSKHNLKYNTLEQCQTKDLLRSFWYQRKLKHFFYKKNMKN